MTIPSTIGAFDAAWFDEHCDLGDGRVVHAEAERIAVGEGFLGELARVSLTYEGQQGPASVIVKIPTTDGGLKPVGTMLGVYERESRFYDEVAPMLTVRTARCLFNGSDPVADAYALVLEDVGHLDGGDQAAGMDLTQAV
ncbi:MAG: ecdysteroid 22-kinase family protein, partial [Acidimicrobiia bacterium]|nr:ecdysteroid 22-kinase family protein [Acidimicrobiia bacterium]